MKTCASCNCELTTETRQHQLSVLCKECYKIVRVCSHCKTPKALADFYGKNDYKCRECVKLLSRPGDKQCATCGTTLAAIEFPLNSKDCPDCFHKRRKCSRCNQVKPLTDFHKVAAGSGLRRVCKECVTTQRNDEYHRRKRKCRICQTEQTEFPFNSQICINCFDQSRRCASCDSVKPISDFRHPGTYCIECARQIDSERRDNKKRTCISCHKEKLPNEFAKFKKICNECRTTGFQSCSICGIEQPLSEFSERNEKQATGFAKRCKSCMRDKSRSASKTIKGRYNQARASARTSGVIFSIEFEDYAQLASQSCHYCGHPLNETGSGLDRLNPLGGYTLDNVVPCCRPCNWTKSAYFTHDEMLVIGEAIGRVKTQRLQHGTTSPNDPSVTPRTAGA